MFNFKFNSVLRAMSRTRRKSAARASPQGVSAYSIYFAPQHDGHDPAFRCWWLVPESCVYYRCAEIPLRDHQHSLVFLFYLFGTGRTGGRAARAGGCQAGGPGLDKPSPAQPSLEPSLSDSEQANVQLSESDWEKVSCLPPGPAHGVYFAPQTGGRPADLLTNQTV
jgi:hypothetical protein